jgi:hypothetical protein
MPRSTGTDQLPVDPGISVSFASLRECMASEIPCRPNRRMASGPTLPPAPHGHGAEYDRTIFGGIANPLLISAGL